MLRKPVEAALFDMDGLLIDSEAVYIRAYQDAAAEIGAEISMDLCHAMVGVPRRECEEMIQEHYGPAFDVPAFQLCFRRHSARHMEERVPVKPGAAELLAFLGDRGIKLGVATSAQRASVERYLGRAGLLDRFAAIATRADIERPKPHPDVYLEAARRLGVDPARCLAFEDSNIGLEAAHAAGMMAFMVPDLLAPTPESHARAVRVLPDLHAAVALLREHL